MPQPSIFKLGWPRSGFVEDSPRAEQPEGTTTDCLNVRNYDSLERRNRGGKRSGLTKLADDAVNAGNPIQGLTPTVEALDLVQSAAWGDQYTNPPVTLNPVMAVWSPAGDRIAFRPAGSPRDIQVVSVSGTVVATLSASHTVTCGSNSNAQVENIAWSSDGSVLFVVSASGTSDELLEAYPYDNSTGFGALLDSEVTVAFSTLGSRGMGLAVAPDNSAVVVLSEASPYLEAWSWNGTTFGAKYSDPSTLPSSASGMQAGYPHVVFHPDGDVVFVSAGSGVLEAWTFDSASGWGTKYTSPSSPTSGTIGGGLDISPSGLFVVRVGDTSSSTVDVYPFDKVTGWGAKTTATATSGCRSPKFSPDGGHVLLPDNTAGETRIYPFSNTIGTALSTPGTVQGSTAATWAPTGLAVTMTQTGGTTGRGLATYAFTPAGTNPSARESRLVAAVGGSVYRSSTDFSEFTLVSSGSAALSQTAPYIDGAVAFQNLFFCDGLSANYQYLDFSDNTLKDWEAACVAELGAAPGAAWLPQGSTDTALGCRIIANYRGRIVLSGLKEDPQNWFMSAKDNPFDWDYSPSTTSATQAVAGNNADAGLMGDIITGLFPYKDDLLVMGGANEINIMSGDPADGGAIDNLTRNVGIAGPHAGCFDTVGNFYFFGVNGLYRVSAGLGSQPQLVSQGKLDRTLSDIDVSANDIRLHYDPFWQGVHIFVVPSSQPSTAPIHFFYDERNDAFWRDQYPASVGPTSAVYLATDNPENSGLVIGGWDGYVRRFDPDALTDDGTAIDSFLRFTPLSPGDIFASSRIDDMTFLLDKGSGNVQLDLFAGDTVEDAEDQADANTPRFRRTLVGGRNTASRPRVSQNAFIFELSHAATDSTWAYESGGGRLAVLNRMRGRRV